MKTLALTLLISLSSITLQAKEPNWKALEEFGISKADYYAMKKDRSKEVQELQKAGYEKACFYINKENEEDSQFYYSKLIKRQLVDF